ncbi:MAG: hypothetical protein IPI46_01240 [Bacteroidetes bacterium]|nr:hypothetical protein [Bacteroidota bacterium]
MRKIITISIQAESRLLSVCRHLSKAGMLAFLVTLLTIGFSSNVNAQACGMTVSSSPPSWNGTEECTAFDPSTIGGPSFNYSGTCTTPAFYNYQWQRSENFGPWTNVLTGTSVLVVPGYNPGVESNPTAGAPLKLVLWRLLVQDITNGVNVQTSNFAVYIASPLLATGPSTITTPGCQDQATVDGLYSTWESAFSFTGGLSIATATDLTGFNAPAVCPGGGNTTITYTATDGCTSSSFGPRSFTVPANAGPVLGSCAVTRNIDGCSTGDITGPSYSTTSAASSEAEFENATNLGSISDNCAITSVTYIDVLGGTPCNKVITRTWTLTDACGVSVNCNQTINVNAPAVNLTVGYCLAFKWLLVLHFQLLREH